MKTAAVALLVVCIGSFQPQRAAAQDGTGDVSGGEQVDKDLKGTVGLGMIGAEVGLLMPGITGLTDTWAWTVFPVIGAAGGAVGGYFLFDNQDNPSQRLVRGAVATLAVGMALVIPAAVGGLALANKADERADFADETESERRQRAAARAGSGLVRFSPEGTFVRAPGIAPLFGRDARGRRDRGTLVSLLSGRF